MPMMNEPVKPLRVVRLLAGVALLIAAGTAAPAGRGGQLAAFDGRCVVDAASRCGVVSAPTSSYRVAASQNQTTGQSQNGAGANVDAAADVKSLHVQGNVWMLVGGGVNAAVQIGDDGVLVVDTMTEPLADKMLAEIRRLAGDKPIRYVINTHVHPDHTGGNEKIAGGGTVDRRRQLRRPGRTGCREPRGGHRARERAEPHERAGRQPGAAAVQGVADRHVLRRRQGPLLQRRGRRARARAGRAHRRRRHGVVPQVRRGRRRRPLHHDHVPGRSTCRSAAISRGSSPGSTASSTSRFRATSRKAAPT